MTAEGTGMTSPGRKGSRRLYVLWAVTLGLLVVGALLSWLVVVPVMQVRAAVGRHISATSSSTTDYLDRAAARAEIEDLGGQEPAASKLAMYLRLPRFVAGDRGVAADLLGHCDGPAVPALMELLKDEDEHRRYGAATHLGRIRDRRAIPALEAMSGDVDAAVAQAAKLAVESIRRERGAVQGAQTGPPHLRIGAFRDLADRRSETEDRLRRRVLEIFHDESRLRDLRRILNEPWTAESVRLIGDMLADDLRAGIRRETGSLSWSQRARLLNLMAYVGSTCGGEAAEEAVASFDVLWPLLPDEKKGRSYMCSDAAVLRALANHGSAAFMTEAFWKHYEGTGDGFRFLAKAGEAKALERLQALQRKNHWARGTSQRSTLDDAAAVIEAGLAEPEIRRIKDLHKRVQAARLFLMGKKEPELKNAWKRWK